MDFSTLEDYNDEAVSKRPWGARIVFTSTCVLTIISVFGPSAAIYVYMQQIANTAIDACQIIQCCASALSLVYVTFYILAARRDESVGSVRPPSRPWHNPCFITLRIAVITWLISAVASMITGFKATCTDSPKLCLIQKVEGGISIGAFVLSILILSLLEKCSKPFTTPAILNIKPKITCRVSQFRDDLLLERSVSRAASFDLKHRPLQLARKQWTDQYSLPSNGMVDLIMPQEEQKTHSQEPASPILERETNHRVESWGSAWTHLATETGCKSSKSGSSKSSSYVSSDAGSSGDRVEQRPMYELSSSASNSSMSDSGASWASTDASSVSSASSSPKKASPSSSISNPFRRSKLAAMRTTESPETVIQEQLLFHPIPGSPSPEHQRSPRRKSVRNPKKTASPQGLRKYASDNALFPAPLNIRRETALAPRSSSQPSAPTLRYTPPPRMQLKYPVLIPASHKSNMSARRKSIDCRIPGQFEEPAPTSHEDSLTRHTRMIEDAIYASASTAQTVTYTRQNSTPLIVQQSPRATMRQSSSLPDMKFQDIPAPLRIGRNLTPPKQHLTIPNERQAMPRSDSGFDNVDGDEYVYKRIVSEKSPRIATMYLDDARLLWQN